MGDEGMILEQINPPNKNWFRIPEREGQRARADKELIVSFWKVQQKLVRVGYEWEPMDFDFVDVEKRARELMANEILGTMRLWDNDEKVSKRAGLIVNDLVQKFGMQILPEYKARGRMMAERNGQTPDRTFWYQKVDPLGQDFNYFMVTGTKRCVTGKYQPGYANHGWDDYEWNPPYIERPLHHTIFTGLLFCDFGAPARFDQEHFQMWGKGAMMHPADLLEEVR
jgi:hypothetical protein